MSENKSITHSGIDFLGLLAIVFIALKLTDVVDWSWWWVLSPLWMPWVFFGVIAGVALLFITIFKKLK